MNSNKALTILDKYYQPKMHWASVNRKNVLQAMEEYAAQFQQQKQKDLLSLSKEFSKVIESNDRLIAQLKKEQPQQLSDEDIRLLAEKEYPFAEEKMNFGVGQFEEWNNNKKNNREIFIKGFKAALKL